MANHGVVTYADELNRAFMHMETVEHFAKITLVARTLGNPKVLESEEVKKLTAIRRQLEAARLEASERRTKFEVVNSSSY